MLFLLLLYAHFSQWRGSFKFLFGFGMRLGCTDQSLFRILCYQEWYKFIFFCCSFSGIHPFKCRICVNIGLFFNGHHLNFYVSIYRTCNTSSLDFGSCEGRMILAANMSVICYLISSTFATICNLGGPALIGCCHFLKSISNSKGEYLHGCLTKICWIYLHILCNEQ